MLCGNSIEQSQEGDDVFSLLSRVVYNEKGFEAISSFNDNKETTHQDIIFVLDKAIDFKIANREV